MVMDIASGKKTPEADSDSTTARIQVSKLPVSFSNGVLKRNHHTAFNNNQTAAAAAAAADGVFVYKECLKNHAASLGAHAVDGCGEFMPSPTTNSADPTSLKCAACGCHRNFHRREPDDVLIPSLNTTPGPALEYQPHHRHHPPPPPPPPPPNGDGDGDGSHSSPSSESPPPISSSYYPSAPHLLLTLNGGMSTANNPQEHITSAPAVFQSNGRKRFRTRFTQDQKGKMLEFAEKLGWKMQRRDDGLIAGFCNEIGVERGVFKVWMHNNKSNFGKSHSIPSGTNTNSGTTRNNGNGIAIAQQYHQNHESLNENKKSNNHFVEQNQHQNHDSFSGRVVGANGSSSSS